MVTHDYERGVISGLPKSVLDHVRRTGRLPDDAMSVNLRAVWEGLLWQKAHAAEPPGMTVAEILRVRDGWDDAFDPVAWERMTGGKVPFSPALDGMAPGPGEGSVLDPMTGKPAPESATGWMCDCGESVADRHPLGSSCGDGGKGKVSAITEYSASIGDDLCLGGYSCAGGDACGCYTKAIQLGIGAGAGECSQDQKFMMADSGAKCEYNDATGRCDCKVQCGNGAWVTAGATEKKPEGTGYPVCETRTDAGHSMMKPACGGPLRRDPFAPITPGPHRPSGIWPDCVQPENSLEKFLSACRAMAAADGALQPGCVAAISQVYFGVNCVVGRVECVVICDDDPGGAGTDIGPAGGNQVVGRVGG